MSQSGKLYKGYSTISGDTTLLDSLKENTGFESSFYYDNRVIITTIMRTAGGRITDSDHMPDKVYQNVIKDGKDIFLTDLKIQETEYYAYFKPLINADGYIAGCIFAGKPSTEVNSQIQAEANKKAFSRNDELGDMYSISYSLQEELKNIVANIKTSTADLTNSSEDLMGLSKGTIDSVASVYDSGYFGFDTCNQCKYRSRTCW